MKVRINEHPDISPHLVLEEIYSGVVLRTEEGNQFAICMRDDTVEMSVVGSDKWYRADMETGDIEEM